MTLLRLSMLGRLNVYLDDHLTLKFRTKRTQALLFYLVTEETGRGVLHNREELMELLWPGVLPTSARSSLRQTLYYLRQAIGDTSSGNGNEEETFLVADRENIWLNAAYPLQADVLEFRRLLAGGEEKLPQAVELYQGDFLADFYLPDSSTFEQWAASRRAAYRRQALDALDLLTNRRLEQADYDQAERYALRQLEIDNIREGAYRALMQLYAWTGRQSEAINIYQECVRVLDEAFGSPPDDVTTALYEAIRDGTLPTPQEQITLPIIGLTDQAGTTPPSPYRGLLAFRQEDAPFFYGREAFTRRLVQAVEKRPIVPLIGPSGSGKSSVLHAGLIAHLLEEECWRVAAFRPGSQPFFGIAAALLPLLEPEMTETDLLIETGKMASALQTGELRLRDVTDRCLQRNPGAPRLLLAIDQFEELYTLVPEREERQRFIDALLETISLETNHQDPAVSLVLALRTDYLDRALSHPRFADALQHDTLILGLMSSEELAEAIVKPAEAIGTNFEAGLTERILTDVGDEPGNLPLLEFALDILWKRQSGRKLTHSAYDAIGGVDGALTSYADEVFNGLDISGQQAARQVFVQLVRPGQQTADSRRLALLRELGEANWRLARILADARLVVIGRDPAGQETAELAHETLIHHWDLLRGWLQEDRSFRLWQERLRGALAIWEASGKDEGALLRGAPLTEADSWLHERREQLSRAEAAFIEAGCALQDQKEAEREKTRLAREQTRQRIVVGLIAGLLISIGLTALAAWQWNSARQARVVAEAQRDQTRNALAQSLASQAQLLVDDQLDLALLLAVEAFNMGDSHDRRGNLLSVVSHNPKLRAYIDGHEDQVRTVVLSPDGRTFASGGDDNAIHLWDLATGQPLGPPLTGHTGNIRGLDFSPDGRLLVSASFDGDVILWDVEGGRPYLPPVTGHSSAIWSVVFSPDGQLVASGDAAGIVRFWDAKTGSPIGSPLSAHSATVAALAFSPAANILASAGRDNSLRLWSVSMDAGDLAGIVIQALAPPLKGHGGTVRALSFSPDGKILAMDGDDNSIALWDLSALNEVLTAAEDPTEIPAVPIEPFAPPLVGHNDWVTSLSFAPDSSLLASAARDGQLIVWDLASLLVDNETAADPDFQSIEVAGQPIWSLAFSPGGRTLVSGTSSGNILLYDLTGQQPLSRQFPGPRSPEQGLAFSPDGGILAAGGRDNVVSLYDVSENSRTFGQSIQPPLTGHDNRVYGAAFSPDGRTLATSDADGLIILWDTETWEPKMSPLIEHEAAVWDLAYSPDGRFLASGSADNTVRIWDASSGRPLVPPLTGHEPYHVSHDVTRLSQWAGPHRVLFSPDGNWLASLGIKGDVILWDIRSLDEEDNRDANSLEDQTIVPHFTWQLDLGPSDGLAFSQDSRLLAAATIDGKIFLFDVISGERVGELLSGNSSVIDGLVFSPEGDFITSISRDGRINFWDIAEESADFGQPYGAAVEGPALFSVAAIAASSDGSRLASISAFRNVVIWDISLDSWLAHACRRANRNMTGDEWRRFFGDEPYRRSCPDLPAADS